MKRYTTIGELLSDYRKLNNVSKSDLAAMLDVDIRSVMRWEKNETWIKPEKEKDLVEQTFIPHQVIRNLNAKVPIPVFYDFKIRKYSLSEISIGLPDENAFKAHLSAVSPMIKPILNDQELIGKYILQFHRYLYKADKPVSGKLIHEASKLLPELNLVMYDNAGYYVGHSVVFPLRNSVYTLLRDREIVEGEIKEYDLINFRNVDLPVFYLYSFYADCNENVHFMMNSLLKFFQNQNNYLFSSLIVRPDALKLMESFGLEKLWEEKLSQPDQYLGFIPTFVEGNFKGIVSE